LLAYYDAFIENEIVGNICELHIHLNGTTESDKVWIDVLKKPYDFYKDLKKGFTDKNVKRLFHQIDINLDDNKFFRYLLFARKIRDYLYLKYIEDNEELILCPNKIDDFSVYNDKLLLYINHPMERKYESKNDLLLEGLFYFRIFGKFNEMCIDDKKLFHLYLLIKSTFLRLLIQQIDQYGFDQFQYITMNEMREMSEKSYTHRFNQLNSFYGNQLHHLEGRFAPKSDFSKMKRLIDTIIKDYRNFARSEDNKNYSFTLVAHFIKKKDKPNKYYPYRFYKLRNDLKKQAINFISILNLDNYEYRDIEFKYRDFIKGIDAAANELHAPPEVFAPIFRMISRRFRERSFLTGNNHLGITYHCGEDFVHLISGMRAIFEAVKFLDMKEKDRIGHGTAIGISPSLWLKKIPPKIKIKKGEWLDNLVFAYHLIIENGLYFNKIHILEEKIRQLFREIYKQSPTLSEIINSYFLRKLDPEVVFYNDITGLASMDLEELNYEKIVGFNPSNEELELLRLYHDYDCYVNYNEIIEIESNFFNEGILNEFQEIILKELNSKQIAIETMPTSNLRISFYESYKDHHIFRWLDEVENKPSLVICSDDPGIFATNLRNEYLHVNRYVKDKNKLLNIARNSKIYKF
jgi:adenosine deaminase